LKTQKEGSKENFGSGTVYRQTLRKHIFGSFVSVQQWAVDSAVSWTCNK